MKHFSQKLADHWYTSVGIFWLLWPVEVFYISLVKVRRALYHLNILPTYRAPCPVIVIGNITIGGAGKTPVVIELARNLQNSGFTVGVISRGYGGASGPEPLIVNNDTKPSECGDEAILIYRKANCPVAVHSSRSRAARVLIDNFSPDLILSDDGLQHYNLVRDLEIVMIDDQRDLGNGHCLPVGPLREPVARLKEADIILRRGGSSKLSVSYQPGAWKPLKDVNLDKSKTFSSSLPVHAVAGLGQPEQFFSMLEGMGLSITRFSYADHHQYQQTDFDKHKGEVVVMTEKDAVKCKDLNIVDAWFLEIKASLPNEVLEKIIQLVSSAKITKDLIAKREVI